MADDPTTKDAVEQEAPPLEEEAVPPAAGDGAQAAEEPVPDEDAVDADLAELHERAGRADEYLELAQRAQADFDNYRRRMTREVAAAEVRGVSRLAKELLPALDNLDRALAAAEAAPEGSEHHLAEGIRLVQAELSAGLQRIGIEGYDPRGEPFDPNQHEAMAQQPVDGTESGTIVEVYQPGYRLNETVLRPARVVVAA